MKKLHISREFIQEKQGYIFSEQIVKSRTPIDAIYAQSNCIVPSTISKLLVLNS